MAENTLAENITQAISDFASIKTAIQNKGVTVPSGTPTSQYSSCVDAIPIGDMGALIDGSVTHATIPAGTTTVRVFAFYSCANLVSVTIPDSLTAISNNCFQYCTALAGITFGNGITAIGGQAFSGCRHLANITWGSSVTTINNDAFLNCTSLTSLNIPSTVTNMGSSSFQGCKGLVSVNLPNSLRNLPSYVFYGCSNLETINIPASITNDNATTSFGYCPSLVNVTIENGFNINNLNLSSSTRYTASTIVGWLNALYDRTGLSAYTLTIGADNIAKLTAEETAIATNKNWNLA